MSMNGGDAAEQMVRILLDGTETMVRITGEGAREVAAFLYAWARQDHSQNPTHAGRTSMARLLRSGQELQVFRMRPEEYAAFRPQARQYRLLYAALRNKQDKEGPIDLVVRTDEIPRVNHILESIGYGGVQQGENSKKKNLRRRKAQKMPGASRCARQKPATVLLSASRPCAPRWSCIVKNRPHYQTNFQPERKEERPDDHAEECRAH